MVHFTAAACSDKGKKRLNNEDNFWLNGQYMTPEQRDEGGAFSCETEDTALYAVCDGMGGQEAGEDASLTACKCCEELQKEIASNMQAVDLYKFMQYGCVRVLEQAQNNKNNSGSTIAMLIAGGDGLIAANMGDSRIYHAANNRMTQISEDHSEVMRLLKLGKITRDEIKTHPLRHMILQYWGMPLKIAPFDPFISKPIPYADGDKFLICSDGLTDMMEDSAIEAVMLQNKTVKEIARELVDKALENGGRDNVTVIVVAVEGEETVRIESAPPKEKGNWWLAAAIALCAAALIYLVFIVLC